MGQKWVTPADFWRLAPGEIWWMVEALKPPANPAASEAVELYDMMRAEQERERMEADG